MASRRRKVQVRLTEEEYQHWMSRVPHGKLSDALRESMKDLFGPGKMVKRVAEPTCEHGTEFGRFCYMCGRRPEKKE
mgnify:CR=1 FL=1